MANAGCINAYDCNGCLIQTLQNLDSACIGVGVQYTAPNPLDDKRLDYIKYTDKCGCVQCLSGENEILIYATDGVIKNLTLTNDDVNEAIKIKWNDIFGSNRAKTIVRYKTGSAPVSITDGTLAVEETTKNQYSSTPFSLSGVLDETTYYITAFAVDSNNAVISSQQATITTDFGWHPSANTLARYKFENNLNDSSGNSRNLTSSGSISYNSNPLSVQLNSSSYLYRNSFDAFNHDWTLNVWFNLNTRNSDSSCIFYVGQGATQKAMILGIENTGKPIAAFYGQDHVGSTITQLNQRYNICYVYDNTTKNIKVYINSIKDIDGTASYTITNTTAYIGWFYFMTPQSRSAFQGKLSQYIIENKKRSETDITEYFNKTKSQYGY